MRLEVTYIAFDETEFDNERECLEYEKSLQKLSGGVQWFNENREIMKDPGAEDIECYAMYMRVVDAEAAADLFDWLYGQISFEKPKGTLKNGQVFAYNCDNGEWDDMNEILNRIKGVIEDIEGEAYRYEHS